MHDGFIKVAAATPKIKLADPAYNAQQVIALMKEAAGLGVKVMAFPELCLTGYSCGDLFLQPTLIKGAEEALASVLEETRDLDVIAAIGLPICGVNKLYNCAAIIHKGELRWIVPKTHIPNYGEFYESRWFAPGQDEVKPMDDRIRGACADTDALVYCAGQANLVIGVEICEDLWACDPPSRRLAEAGATLILNLSASNEVAGKATHRRELVKGQSARCVCGYVMANAGEGESTADLVFGGHNLIAENGTVLAEDRFHTGLTISEIDVDKLAYERRRMNTFPPMDETERIKFSLDVVELEPCETTLTRPVAKNPFLPADPAEENPRCEEILQLAALGLKQRLAHANAKTAVLGLSGGLDSTLAALICAKALDLLGRPRTDLLCVTMPCFGTTERTKGNAEILAERLGAALRVVDISRSVEQHFVDISQKKENHDVTFENAQARERTQVLMDLANQTGGLVVGTGDMSELALGWCTYNGDQMSMYAVNASIPKTLVRRVTAYAADTTKDEALAAVLRDILDTPVSPELLPAEDGQIAQKTEDLVGPYELHDFFLYHILRWGAPPRKVLRLAEHAFAGDYDHATILKWLKTFYRRFFTQQFKRNASPDGPKVCEISLSPRGDWRMPSDVVSALWLKELEGLE